MTRKPKLLVFNQYYWPGVEATAHLLSELCAALAEDFEINVVTGALRERGAQIGHFEHDDVKIVRVRSTSFDRRRLGARGINYLTYLVQSFRTGLMQERPDIVLCMTDPPVVANAALIVARRFRAPLVVISQDVFPEIAVELGRLENGLLLWALRRLIGAYLSRADSVVAIGETMRARLIEKGAQPGHMSLIPNWVDADAIKPDTRKNRWAREHNLHDRFVVMHSGNVGHAQDLDVVIRASTFLRDLDDLVVAIIGGGARYAELVRLTEILEADKVSFLPYQPRERLSQSLSTGHLHFVGLAHGLAGYVVPSRLYGVLSAGRPVIVSADPDSETAMVVERVGCGIVVPPGRPDLVAGVVRDAHAGRYDLDRMGALGREYVLKDANRPLAVSRYRALLQELMQRQAA